MSFRLVSSGGNVTDPAVLNMRASGTIWPGGVVDLATTSGLGVQAAASTSNQSYIFGVALDYVEGAQDDVRVIPFASGQVWEADCTRAAATAHINLKNILRDAKTLDLIATDTPGVNGIFQVLAMVGSTSGSGKVLGRFLPVPRCSG